MNVLIVEDNPISSKVLEHPPDKYGHETYSGREAKPALEYLDAHREIPLVPNTDGFELIRRIKDRRELNDIPVLLCRCQSPIREPKATRQYLTLYSS